MKERYSFSILVFLITVISFFSCKKKNDTAPQQQPVAGQLTISAPSVNFTADGGSQDVTVTSNADWTLSNPESSWLQVSPTSGKSGNTVIHLSTISQNATGLTLSGILYVTPSNGSARKLIVTQLSTMYPTYNTSPIAPDMTGMTSTAVQQAAGMKLGMNIGNTLEASGNETGWGNPVITEDYIKFIKQSGFNSIRLPCSWDQHSDPKTAKIQDAWLSRVKQVVQYCINNNMYVLLNIHWDGGWLENNCTPDKKDSVNAKQKAFWEQIATTMRDFDGHLMFASANEPNVSDATQMSVLLSYHQTFINAVRSTGGRNSYRVLVIQGPSTDMDKTINLMNTLPTDQVPNRIMVEIHNYTPFQFAGLSSDASWGKMFYYWGAGNHSTIEPSRNATYGEEADMNVYFQGIKQKFVDKGIPVLMGEYAAGRRSEPLDMAAHQASVDYWITFMTKQALANGLKPFYWDTGGVLNRQNNTVNDQRTLNAIIAGGQ